MKIGYGLLVLAVLHPAASRGEQHVPRHSAMVIAVGISPDQRTIVSGCKDGTLCRWNLADNTKTHSVAAHGSAVSAILFLNDGSQFLSASHDGVIKIWDTSTMKPVAVIDKYKSGIAAACLSPDEKRVATANIDGTLRVVRIQDQQALLEIKRQDSS